MLTPTMKIKRNVIHEAYKDQYQAWFDAEETVIMQ
jgi:long-subunit acyl-CoA synthetase (AMP-forming)